MKQIRTSTRIINNINKMGFIPWKRSVKNNYLSIPNKKMKALNYGMQYFRRYMEEFDKIFDKSSCVIKDSSV